MIAQDLFTVDKHPSIKSHFMNLDRNIIIADHKEKISDTKFSVNIIKTLNGGPLKKFYKIHDDTTKYPILIKIASKPVKGKSIFRFVKDYEQEHLYNSIIQNILFDAMISEANKIYFTTYISYYYWYMKDTMKTMDQISKGVCCDLEQLIKTIIDKEMTVYRESNTNNPLSLLRERLRSERILVNERSTINFRR